MKRHRPILFENVVVDRDRTSIAVIDGMVVAGGVTREDAVVIDGQGGRLIPGLIDHHLHLMATAARAQSLDLSGLAAGDFESLVTTIRTHAGRGPVRAIGLDYSGDPLLDRDALDRIAGDVPVRVQYRTGGIWVLNSAALDQQPIRAKRSQAFERDGAGRLTGRVWRGEQQLERDGNVPSLDAIGAQLARWGVTGIVDASVSTDQQQAEAVAAVAQAMPQRLTLMGANRLEGDGQWHVGPVKIMLDDAALPAVEAVTAIIRRARTWGRPVAAHCVTAGELAIMVAAFDEAGAELGDRIEHGASIPSAYLDWLAKHRLTVVSQPAFVLANGERYRRDVDPHELGDLWRMASLIEAGVAVAASSDAPYGPLNPWLAIRAAAERLTQLGNPIGLGERIDPERSLSLYLGTIEAPGTARREVRPGVVADLALLEPNARIAIDEDPVRLTVVGGEIVWDRMADEGAGQGDGTLQE